MFIVKTQVLENYGAHCDTGKYADGKQYWKFKSGSDYLVRGLESAADAMAFVMAAFSENTVGYKEFPVEVLTMQQWREALDQLDSEYREFLMDQTLIVSPETGTDFKRGL